MILEGLCTTININGSVNIAPMGPIVDFELTTFLFRPFQSSTTFQNLKRTRCGVFHVTDDAGMIARAAIGMLHEPPEFKPAVVIDGQILSKACRWYEFEVLSIDDAEQRTEIRTELRHTGRIRDFWGFNRARHAILEAAILATRLHLLSVEEIEQQMRHLEIIVQKTASQADTASFELLQNYIAVHSK